MPRPITATGGRDATLAVIPGRFALSVGRPDLPAADGWNWTRLTDLARLESGHTPSRSRPEYWGGDVPWIGIRDATANHGRRIHDTTEHTNALGIANSSARILPAETVCLSRTASVGYVVMMGRPMATSQDFVNWVCGPRLNPHFLKYVLIAERQALHVFATGSVHQTIYFPEAKAFHVCAPARREQDAIVDVLGALDDKIELNRRMNETLEAMARAIFKDWFVDFGPTRAKQEGRPPYLSPDLWALFPARLDDQGKPETWKYGKLGDLARQAGEAVSPEALDPDTPYIGLEHMPRRSLALGDWEGAGKVTSTKLAFSRGDFLFGKLRPYFHKVGIAPVDGICSTDVVVLNARARNAGAFVITSISQDEFIAFTDRTSDGTKMPRTSWGRMQHYELCMPSTPALTAFNVLVEPMLDKILANIHESRTLAATRDLLLPKLMSGEIRVKDAEAVVPAVT